MNDLHDPHIAAIYRYPVKGLSPQALDKVAVTPGETLPLDRAYAIENGPGRFDPLAPKYAPKINFLMLMRDERLASLQTEFEEANHEITIMRDRKQVAKGQLTTSIGRQLIEQFVAAYMKDSLRGRPRIVAAQGHSFSDVPSKCIHIVNLATVRDLSRALGHGLDPLRFRANIYVENVPAWSEFEWLGRMIGLGEVSARVFARTERCEATSVNPQTARRDISLPAGLLRLKGHMDIGVYAQFDTGGLIAAGDRLELPADRD